MVVAKSSRLSATNSDAGLQIDDRGIRPHPPARTRAKKNRSTPVEVSSTHLVHREFSDGKKCARGGVGAGPKRVNEKGRHSYHRAERSVMSGTQAVESAVVLSAVDVSRDLRDADTEDSPYQS